MRRVPLLLLAVLLALLAGRASAHGYLAVPRPRNLVAHEAKLFWNEASGNGLGTNHSPNGPGACGDPFQTTNSNFVAEPSPIQATFREGQEVELRVMLTTNHGGKMNFRVCPRRTNLDEACFGRNYLTRVDNGQRDTWILDMSQEFTLKYKLPQGLSCADGCVLQWHYFAMQSCVERGCDQAFCRTYALGNNEAYNSWPGFCDSARVGARPEFFNNCADIRILPLGGSGGAMVGGTRSRRGRNRTATAAAAVTAGEGLGSAGLLDDAATAVEAEG